MVNTAGRLGLKAALYARRKRMGKTARNRPRKSTRWLYPLNSERRYRAAIRAWLRPLRDYVHKYLKNNQAAILRGDSTSLIRQDTLPGGSYRRMVSSLFGWYVEHFPPINEFGVRNVPPLVFFGLGSISESISGFNGMQWNKAARANLGVEFPVYESWWPAAKLAWQEDNYRLIKNLAENYIKRINIITERAITSGLSPAQLMREIRKIDKNIIGARANLIARDQIGKLNGRITQARMEAVGLSMYEWSTSMDERVRGDPAGIYPNARPSHYRLEGMICRWDNSRVYSNDGGKTWKSRPLSWAQLHPGEDIQCRCTALSYWDELVNEVDREINNEVR